MSENFDPNDPKRLLPLQPLPAGDPRFQGIGMAAGIWNRGTDAVHAQWNIAVDDFKQINDIWINKGFNIIKLFSANGLWGALWRKNAPGVWNWIGADAEHLIAKATKWHTVEHRHVVDLHCDAASGTYGGLWLAGDGAAHIETNVPLSQFKSIEKKQWKAKMRLHRLKWISFSSSNDFSGLWRSGEFGTSWGRWPTTRSFKAEIDKAGKMSHLVDFDVHGGILNAAWMGLWHSGHIQQKVSLAIPLAKFQKTIEEYRKDGYHLSNVALYSVMTTDGLTP